MAKPPSALSFAVNLGTGSRRLRKTSEAWSSNLPSAAHSIRINRGVRTVNRALPWTTTVFGSAAGMYAPGTFEALLEAGLAAARADAAENVAIRQVMSRRMWKGVETGGRGSVGKARLLFVMAAKLYMAR